MARHDPRTPLSAAQTQRAEEASSLLHDRRDGPGAFDIDLDTDSSASSDIVVHARADNSADDAAHQQQPLPPATTASPAPRTPSALNVLPSRLTPSPTPSPGQSSGRPTPSGSPSPPGAAGGPPQPKRQSSFAQPRPGGTPRTPNRVRFDVAATSGRGSEEARMGEDEDDRWVDEEDWMEERGRREGGVGLGLTGLGGRRGARGRSRDAQGRREPGEQHLPLLTGIEAPSVTVAGGADEGFEAEDLLESSRPKSGMRSAFMNMANSIIGAGIIGQPYAFRQAGLLTGVVLLIGLTIVVDWTIRLIVTNSKMSGTNSFQATVEHCFGKSGLIAISIAQWAFAFGGMVAFCIIVGDTIPRVLAAIFPSLANMSFLWLLTDRKAVIVLLILGISYPLSLYRDIAKLAKASTLALISMLIIIITVVTQGFGVPTEERGRIQGSLVMNAGIFQAIGVISFAFVCHHNSLLIYGSLQKPTMDRFARVTHYSTGVSMVACLIMALSGFLTFGDKTQGNVLNNFPLDNIMVNIARLCFGLNMLTTLPLECFVCREVMNNYWFPGEPHNPHLHLIFTTALVISAMTLSLLTCDLGAVFELIGATSASALAYVLPPLCFLRLRKTKDWRTWVAWAVITFGGLVMALSVVGATIKMTKNEGGAQTCG
ncbi:transmembrane amino acid transporter protein-domain-containing protein [Lineolata rhizophorae]|uniref:Transmembrane amino acid transporter protein-domain-containing protein n=1 Tax=Lineolata rhizophorae TaxID=578093 RepID=A0A6A6PBF4_9PEZI|nr:transmembrane amino acid transporter protein-domain-containing protein [Lineolata rhizophorae]